MSHEQIEDSKNGESAGPRKESGPVVIPAQTPKASSTNKKNKKGAGKSIPHRDHYARLSFLYQSAQCLSHSSGLEQVGRMYAHTMKSIAKKNVLRISPHIKRNICKKCQRVQIAGFTSTTRLINESKSQASRNDMLVVTCVCGQPKRFPVGQNPDYQLWSDKVKETLD